MSRKQQKANQQSANHDLYEDEAILQVNASAQKSADDIYQDLAYW